MGREALIRFILPARCIRPSRNKNSRFGFSLAESGCCATETLPIKHIPEQKINFSRRLSVSEAPGAVTERTFYSAPRGWYLVEADLSDGAARSLRGAIWGFEGAWGRFSQARSLRSQHRVFGNRDASPPEATNSL